MDFLKMSELNEDYLEVHFDASSYIAIEGFIDDVEGLSSDVKSIVRKTENALGFGGLYLLAKKWTDEFMLMHENTIWGEDRNYFETIREFLNKKKL